VGSMERENVRPVTWSKEIPPHDVSNALRAVVALKPVVDDSRTESQGGDGRVRMTFLTDLHDLEPKRA
jgi:hypothetical protein